MSGLIGVHYVRSNGCWYVYAWRGGPRIATFNGSTRPRLTRELEEQVKDARAKALAGDETIAGLVGDWRRSPEWEAFADTTKRAWTTWTVRIEAKWGKIPLEVWNDPRMVGKVIAWRDCYRETPRSADEAVKVLSRLLEWGRLRARVRLNVAAGIPQLYKGADRSTIIWTPEDYDRFAWSAAKLEMTQALDIRDLGGLTGFRRADLAGLTRPEAAFDHAIMRTALKKSRGRRRRAVVPKLAETHELLDRLALRLRKDDVDTVLVNSFGRAWTPQSLGDCFHRVRDHAKIADPANPELGLPERPKHLHDLRGTFVTHLCRAGLTDRQIADIVAWSEASVAEIRRTYVDDAAIVVAIGERLSAVRNSR